MPSVTQSPSERWDGLREVLNMAWPIMLGAVSFTIMDFTDKVFVSRLGVDNLAAVGSAGIWVYTLGVFFLGIAGCVSTFSSQSLGRGNKDHCARYGWHGVYVAIVAGAAALAFWPFAPVLFGSMRHSPEVTRLEILYFQIRILGFGFVAWEAALSAFFQSVSRPRIPMYCAMTANVTNIVLDWLLIFPHGPFPGLGIAGAAIATVISIMLQAALLHGIFLSAPFDREYHTRSAWRFNWTKLKDLVNIGWPAGVSSFLDVAAWSVFTSYLVGRFGTLQLAAHTAAINYMHLTFIPAIGLSYAITPIVGQWLGRGDVETAKARTYTTIKVGMTYMLTVAVTLAVLGPWLMRVFSDLPEVISLGHTLLILAAVFAGFDAVTIVLVGALRGAGDTRWIMMALAVGSYAVCLPLAWLFSRPLDLGATGAWIGATIYIIALSGAFLGRFRGEAWRHIKIFSEDRETVAANAAPGAVLEITPGERVAP